MNTHSHTHSHGYSSRKPNKVFFLLLKLLGDISVSVTRRSPKPQREVRLLGAPYRKQAEKTGPKRKKTATPPSGTTSIDVYERLQNTQFIPRIFPPAVLAAIVLPLPMPSLASAVLPTQDRIGLPQGETFTIVSPNLAKKKPRCQRVFTWDRPPRVAARVCFPNSKKKPRATTGREKLSIWHEPINVLKLRKRAT